jgi:hypothetical protein
MKTITIEPKVLDYPKPSVTTIDLRIDKKEFEILTEDGSCIIDEVDFVKIIDLETKMPLPVVDSPQTTTAARRKGIHKFVSRNFNRLAVLPLTLPLCLVLVLGVGNVWGQLFTQNFSASSTVSNYVNSLSPDNGQFNAISSSGAGTVLSITSGKLRFARTANAGSYSRTTDFSGPPTSLIYKFDIQISGNSVAQTTAAVFQVGSGFGTANSTQANADVHSRIGINTTATAGRFTFRDLGASSNSGNLDGSQSITWVINNSDGTLTYKAPDGTYETVATDKYDLWAGTTRLFNDASATTTTQTLADLKFVFSAGTATIDLDNIVIDPIPSAPSAAPTFSSVGSTGFTVGWNSATGATGYRLDIDDNSDFSSPVSGYNDLAVAGTSQVVSGLASSTTYYARVRTENYAGTSNHSSSGSQATSSSTPSISLADNGSQVSASSVAAGSSNVILHQSSLAVTTANATLTGVSFTTAGTYAAADVSNFKVWYSADNSFATTGDNTQLGSTITTSLGAGAKSVSSLSQAINSGSTGYIFITTDIAASPTGGNTINVSALTTSDISFSSGSKSGSTTAGGAKTLQSAASPTLSAGTISGSFGNICINTTSSAQSFTLSGSNLNGSDVSVSSTSSRYTFATSLGGSYSNPLTLTAYNGSAPGTIYVKFAPTAAGADNADISIAGGGATAATVSQSGNSGVNTVPTVTTPTSASLSTTTVTLGGTISSIGCSNATTTGIYYSTSNGFADGTGTAVSTGSLNISSTPNVFTQAVTGLTTNTQYYFKAFATNSGGNGYSSQGGFITFPTAPAGLSTGSITYSGFTVSWTDLAGTLEFYEVQIFSDAGFSTQVGSTYTTAANASSQAITGLSASTNYYYRVRAVNNTNQASSYSTGGPVTTSVGPCGTESFTNSNATGSYSNNSFTGDNGVTWTYTQSRDDATYQITGAGLLLRRLSDDSKVVSSSVSGGIGNFTCKLLKGFTGAGNRQVALYINDIFQANSTAWDNTSVQTFTVNDINITGSVVVEIRNITANQVVVDDISWTCYSAPEINVKQSSTSLASGSGSFSLGTVTTGSSSSATTFTIENTGTATLNLTGTPKVAISGHTSDFSIDQTTTSSTVSASGSTTFTVTFSPTTTGARSAIISIANDDSNENPYTFTVTGTGATYAPSVTTSAATSISTTGSTLNGEVTSDGGAAITERGFVYKTSSSVTISDNKTTVAGTTGTFSLSPSSLSVNTQYYFRAYAINSVNTTLGDELNFWTLANAPAAPTVNTPTGSSLNVTIGASDGNPSTTTYAIQETTSGNYVQANGTLGASAVWQTSATWSAITLTGLSSATTYTFKVKARNGANTETAFGSTTSGTTSSIGLNSVILSSALTSTYGSVSSGVSFTASGTNLTSNITATAQSGYQVSTDNSSFGASVSVASGTTIYVGFASTLSAGNYNNQIAVVLSGGGAAGNANVTTSSSGNTVLQKVLSITTATIASKVYDGTTTSGTVTAGTLSGYIGSETVVVASANGTYSDANGGTGKTATITYTLGNGTNGGLATNYSLANTTATGDITQATQTISFTTFTTPITASTTIVASSNFGGAITYSSSNTNVATINSSTGVVTIAGNGTTTITASNAGNSNYTAASTSQVLTVNPTTTSLVTFDFSGIAGSESTSTSNATANGIATTTISRGSGLSSSANADRFNATNWAITSIANAISGNNYMEFTVTPNSGFQFSVSSILFQIQRSGTGLTAIALRSSLDSYASNLDAQKSVVDNTSTQSFTFTFSQANSSSAVTYRLYGYSEAGGGTGGPGDGAGNDIVVNGIVSCLTPSQSSVILGTTTVCSGSAQTYSVTNVSGTGYTWSLPDGSWSGSSTSNSMNANVGSAGGTISVTPYNAASGCSNYTASSQSISVTVNATPNAPTASAQSFCSSASPTVADLTVTSGSSIKWYDASTNGNLVAIETALTSGNYYASQTVSSCESSTRTSISVTVNANGTWIGDSNDDWNIAGNWCGGVPNSSSAVVSIPSGVTVNLDASPSVLDLIVGSGSTLNSGSNTITIANSGTFTNNGTFNAGTGTVAFAGTGTLAGNSTTLNNLTTNGNLTASSSSTVNGTLTLASGTFTVGANNLTISGSINRTSGNIDASNASATVVFGGSSAQTIPASTFTGNINNLTLNNTAGVITNQALTINNTLNLTNGIFTLGANNLTLSGSLHATNNGSTTSYIHTNGTGAFIRSISTTGVDYKFPVGLSDYAPISVNFTGGTISSSILASRAVSGLHPEATDGAYIRTNMYWEMNQTGMTNPQYNVSFTYPGVVIGSGSTESEADLLPAKYSASTGWLSSGSCAVCFSGTSVGTSSVNTSTKTITWNGVSGFSDFGGFGQGNGTPLPVELLSFNASCIENQNVIIWQTASENNSSHFEVEKSRDGETWDVIGQQSASGNSNILLTYQFVDEVKNAGTVYYRLNQVDVDGKNEYFGPVAAACVENGFEASTLPNPSNGNFWIKIQSNETSSAIIKLIDIKGNSILMNEINIQEGINLYHITNLLESGMYFIQIQVENGQKITVLKHLQN